ncbi:MAG: sensor histidine kinase [Vicinamibacterales bacterium]
MVTLLHLTALFVYLFGAIAYGAATLVFLRPEPVWSPQSTYAHGIRPRIDRAALALFAISTVWFVLNALIEFKWLLGIQGKGWLDLGTFIVFFFPPVIMHTMYLESHGQDQAPPSRIYAQLLAAMYVAAPVLCIWVIAAIFGWAPVPGSLNSTIGISIGSLFILASVYCTVIMLRRKRRAPTLDETRLRNVMISLFIFMTALFMVLTFMREERLLIAVLDRVSRATPIYFLIASVYFESRFEFYDLVVKRAALMLMSLVVVGAFFVVSLGWLDRLPPGAARPWLFAVALIPLAMVMPWLHARAERWLDRLWFGREFTSIEAIKHMLAAMQPATNEQSLIDVTEARLSQIFGARIVVLVGEAPPPGDADVMNEIEVPRAITGRRVRFAVLRASGTRLVMSEDLQLLRYLATVFGFMFEKFQMERKRLEQEQLAQDLRLQTSKSELKALRAQINPHFLFNALNAIASLIHTDPGRADEAVEQLAEVFRYTLRRSDSEWAPLDQELAFARAYLDVEQARFGQRLTCSIDSDHVPPVPHVPSMMLQTLIENAIKHGVSQTRGPGRIDVVVRTTSDRITVEVRDSGPGANAPSVRPREGEGFGLRSVRERLQGHFGDRASLSLIRDEAAGMTVARIVMPVVRMAA